MAKSLGKPPERKHPGKKKLPRKALAKAIGPRGKALRKRLAARVEPPPEGDVASAAFVRPADATVLDRLWGVVLDRRAADPAISHSARLLSRGTAKVAQKFGEEAVECLIEAVNGNRDALIGESADVLYHLLVLWVDAGLRPAEVWDELVRREGVSGIAEKASRARSLPASVGLHTSKIP